MTDMEHKLRVAAAAKAMILALPPQGEFTPFMALEAAAVALAALAAVAGRPADEVVDNLRRVLATTTVVMDERNGLTGTGRGQA